MSNEFRTVYAVVGTFLLANVIMSVRFLLGLAVGVYVSREYQKEVDSVVVYLGAEVVPAVKNVLTRFIEDAKRS